MNLQIVNVPSVKDPIKPSPGFAKKLLSDFKLDLVGLCGFGCRYCSSNHGNYLRINRKRFADLTEEQLGSRELPAENPLLMFRWDDFFEQLTSQLDHEHSEFGKGKTLVFSMLTDGFSPPLVKDGTTARALRLVLEKTRFRIRVLTKNSIVGTKPWIEFFKEHADRFIVGLSIGTADDKWAKKVEVGTPPPSRRLKALSKLQDAGIPTYGMLCPVFPDVLENDRLEQLVDAIRPDITEHVWAEPYNDRQNWKHVRDGYSPKSYGYRWMTEVYENGHKDLWSAYATELYVRVRDKAKREGWLGKLRYLLYEGGITERDAPQFAGLEGVLLQSKPGEDGMSQNSHIARLQ